MNTTSRFLIDALPHMVWSARANGEVDYHNDQWCRYTGLSPESSVGNGWRQTVHPDDLEAMHTAWNHSVNSGDPLEIEVRQRRFDGEYRWFLVRAHPHCDKKGQIVRWLGTCTEIHSQKEAESELREAAHRKDEFLAMLGHELRNPLSPIVTALDLIKFRGQNDPFMREHAIIERQVRHLAALVNDMLDISRITQGKVRLKVRSIEISEVLDRSIELASPLLEERRHTLDVDVPRRGMMLRGDLNRLAQVFTNLLTNAAKFTAPGGRIVVTSELDEHDILICVRDNGRGISPDRLTTIFEPFEQGASQAPDRAEGGIGLGLAIVKSLVELHSGTVEVRSSQGQGSEFWIRLPGLEAGLDSDSDCYVAIDDATPRERILVVDDNHDAAVTLAEYLGVVGYHVAVAHDGPTALDKAKTFLPTICLLDIGLPVMDGYELAKRLREIPGLEDVRLVAITGYGQAKDREKARQAGFNEHMVKPVDLGELLRVLPVPAAAAE